MASTYYTKPRHFITYATAVTDETDTCATESTVTQNTAIKYKKVLENFLFQPADKYHITQATAIANDWYKEYYYSGTTSTVTPTNCRLYPFFNVGSGKLTFNETTDDRTWTTWTDTRVCESNINIISLDSGGVYLADRKEILRDRMRSNLVIQIKSRAQSLGNIPQNEQTAIESLREVISETEFRRYLKYGFVLVPGRSGNTYQIFRNRAHTKVWRGGTLVEEVCVRLADRAVPPTDNVLAFKAMIEANEEEFRKSGNVYKMQKAA